MTFLNMSLIFRGVAVASFFAAGSVIALVTMCAQQKMAVRDAVALYLLISIAASVLSLAFRSAP